MVETGIRKAWLFAARAPGTKKDEEDLARTLSDELSLPYRFQLQRTKGAATRQLLKQFLVDIGHWIKGNSPGLLWIAGHGAIDEAGEHRLLTDDIDQDSELSSAFRLRELWMLVRKVVGETQAPLLVVLDVCHAYERGMPELPRNVVVVGASASDQVARGNEGHGGFLTQALLQALRGYGARPDGVVDLDTAAASIRAGKAMQGNGYQDPWWVHRELHAAMELNRFESSAVPHEQTAYDLAGASESLYPLRDVMQETFRRMMKATERGAHIIGIPTGFDRYDRMTNGLHDGELTIVAARAGMGKTSLVLNMAINIASPQELERDPFRRWKEPGYAVVIFSLEMSREEIVNRMICSEARIDVSRARTGWLAPSDWTKLTQAAAHLNTLNIWIDDAPGLSLRTIRSKVRRLQVEFDRVDETTGEKTHRVGLVVVDNVQLMKGREGASSREQEISDISWGLKQLAKDLSLPIIAVSKLNRPAETRGRVKSERPQMSDLGEWGALEQDADNICFIYRDEYYDADTAERAVAELVITKQRNGTCDTIKLRFDAPYTRFDNFADEQYDDR
jgi:replicative DNA helicase